MSEEEIAEGWRQANIARVIDTMRRYNLTVADLLETDKMDSMVNITGTQTPNQPLGNTVAGH